jgi:hypothetical protein
LGLKLLRSRDSLLREEGGKIRKDWPHGDTLWIFPACSFYSDHSAFIKSQKHDVSRCAMVREKIRNPNGFTGNNYLFFSCKIEKGGGKDREEGSLIR